MHRESASSSLPSSSSYPSSRWIYDVFISFRGEDTRNSFVDHLYHALDQHGIQVFKDDLELRKGKTIACELYRAIEQSRFSIIVFSRNYASSTWCLDELVKIVECKNEMGQSVWPIFYHVDPSEVRKQSGNFQEALAEHEHDFPNDLEKVRNWRNALTEVANLSGWDLQDRPESKFIQSIVQNVSDNLPTAVSSTMTNLIGMDSRLRELHCCIGMGAHDVRMIGICGMAGIGKTTLAKVVHDQMSCYFEGSSYLDNVGEVSKQGQLISLQKQLLKQILRGQKFRIWNVDYGANMIRKRLCHKKILVIIDDVDKVNQLENIAGKLDWFGAGSRIIITTRDEHLLVNHGVNKEHIYKPRVLNHDESLKLLHLKAFRSSCPPEDFVNLSEDFIKYACGLPLALEVLGKHLFAKSIHEWRSELDRLRGCLRKNVVDVLQISFDGLEQKDKEVFLDLACFFNGWSKDRVISILCSCGFNPEIGIRNLIDKSLVTIFGENRLQMHDLLQQMGRNIVQKESDDLQHSILWDKQDINNALTSNIGTEAMKGIVFNSFEPGVVQLRPDVFSKMRRLRLLKTRNGLEYLPNNLRLLHWYGYHLPSLPYNFRPDKLVKLDLSESNVKQLWEGTIHLNNLNYMDVSYAQNLIQSPDFTGVPNLKELNFNGCDNLEGLHRSILQLKRLRHLSLNGCTSLQSLPGYINQMISLETLSLSDCWKFTKFPQIIETMESLVGLYLQGTSVTEIPSSIEHLTGLRTLCMDRCRNLVSLSSNICYLKSLRTLTFEDCFRIQNLPREIFGQLEYLEELQLSRVVIAQAPSSIFRKRNLAQLYLRGCNVEYVEIPDDLGFLSSLEYLDLGENNFVTLPTSISQLRKLSALCLDKCLKLEAALELPPDIYLDIRDCVSLQVLSMSPNKDRYFGPRIDCSNCLKLGLNGGCEMVVSLMKNYLIEVNLLVNRFDMIVPGSEIKEWFKDRSEGNSIIIHSPPDSLINDECTGIAVCLVIVQKFPFIMDGDGYDFANISFSINEDTDTYKFNQGVSRSSAFFSRNETESYELDHIWVFFRRLIKNSSLEQERVRKTNTTKMRFENPDGHFEVKRCGVRLVYEHELRDGFKPNHITQQWNSSTVDDGPPCKRLRNV